VERADLSVANMTLEPIAAINVAIPENFRMLNIALVDVGAGTSDICVTRDGSIIAYGMIPYAGDELTEVIVQALLVDFATAEKIKKDSTVEKQVTYKDIMGIEHTVDAKEIWKLTDPVKDKITKEVSEKIKELNGDESVAATFVVGGGGKVHDFCETLADNLGIIKERVALRGEEVMGFVNFLQKDIEKDPLLVTPIGICLNYYEQKNNFIMIHFNGERMKLYDNGHLKIVDAALQAGYSTDALFPRRGTEVHFTVDGSARMARGEAGESAHIYMNGNEVGLNTRLEQNCEVVIEGSTVGSGAALHLDDLEEVKDVYVSFVVNAKRIRCPKFVEVNGKLEPGGYEIQEGDDIETRNFYTVSQLAEFMDVEISRDHEIIVNNRTANLDTLVYENFTVEWTTTGGSYEDFLRDGEDEYDEEYGENSEGEISEGEISEGETLEENNHDSRNESFDDETSEEANDESSHSEVSEEAKQDSNDETSSELTEDSKDNKEPEISLAPTRPNTPLNDPTGFTPFIRIHVTVNGDAIELNGKTDYIFVDIFNVIDFDPSAGGGRGVITYINDHECAFADPIIDGDALRIEWRER